MALYCLIVLTHSLTDSLMLPLTVLLLCHGEVIVFLIWTMVLSLPCHWPANCSECRIVCSKNGIPHLVFSSID